MVDVRELEQRIFSGLFKHGRQDACQLAVSMGYPLSASDELDDGFFSALQNLEGREMIHWRPISSEIPSADDSNPYTGKVYGIGSGKPLIQLLREAYEGIADRIRKYL